MAKQKSLIQKLSNWESYIPQHSLSIVGHWAFILLMTFKVCHDIEAHYSWWNQAHLHTGSVQ